MLISGQNAWVTAYKNVPMNLTRYGGSANGQVLDSAVQEYNLQRPAALFVGRAQPGRYLNVPLSSQSRGRSRASPGMRITSTRSS